MLIVHSTFSDPTLLISRPSKSTGLFGSYCHFTDSSFGVVELISFLAVSSPIVALFWSALVVVELSPFGSENCNGKFKFNFLSLGPSVAFSSGAALNLVDGTLSFSLFLKSTTIDSMNELNFSLAGSLACTLSNNRPSILIVQVAFSSAIRSASLFVSICQGWFSLTFEMKIRRNFTFGKFK
ncbi:hypothetical protein AWRI1631_143350 [Saccharomyces cerevisiae AWRI1631]|uniref:Uncharacterized protein n=1 Tax=Saccharomyces cerevisiae (strain AWRI1631) TaxID=545124 RepID=B5VR54_YEAS6|nr:hypothetical protein AWRI1631_143350 [Saccharomyces cerevisiae AWRI1631]